MVAGRGAEKGEEEEIGVTGCVRGQESCATRGTGRGCSSNFFRWCRALGCAHEIELGRERGRVRGSQN